MKKILTISIAAYNAEKDLTKCLESLIKSKYINDLEIVVVNDGSVDNTQKIATQFQEQFSDSVIVINKENGGHGSTINSGIKVATGKYFKTLDSDDWYDTTNLDKLIEFLKNANEDLVINPHIDVNLSNSTENLKSMIIDENKIKYNQLYDINDVADNIVLAMADMTYKTSLLKKMKYKIDEKCFYVDVEYTIYPIEFINDVIFLDFPVYQYNVGQVNQSTNLKVMRNRSEQHLKVLENLINYKETVKLNSGQEKIVVERINYMINTQYQLYLTMDNKVGKSKLIKFDKWLGDLEYPFYSNFIDSCKSESPTQVKIIKFLRKHNFKFYYVIMFVNNTLKKCLRGYK